MDVLRVTTAVSVDMDGVAVTLAEGDLLPDNHPVIGRVRHLTEPVADHVRRRFPHLAAAEHDEADSPSSRRRRKR